MIYLHVYSCLDLLIDLWRQVESADVSEDLDKINDITRNDVSQLCQVNLILTVVILLRSISSFVYFLSFMLRLIVNRLGLNDIARHVLTLQLLDVRIRQCYLPPDLTQVNSLCLTQPERPVLDLPSMQWWKAELTWWLVTYRDSIPDCRQSPVEVLTGPA